MRREDMATDWLAPGVFGDIAGSPDIDLTGAVVQYRDSSALMARCTLEDSGLGLVLDGKFPLVSDVLDLGSARVHTVELISSIVIVDWARSATLANVRTMLDESTDVSEPAAAQGFAQYCERLGVEVLRRAGFTPVTRPTFLRLAFRDLARDLDAAHLRSIPVAVRRRSAEITFDADNCTLLIDASGLPPSFKQTLVEAFPTAVVSRARNADRYRLRFTMPLDLAEARMVMAQVRSGILHLLTGHEPERYAPVQLLMDTLGRRDTLGMFTDAPGTHEDWEAA